ncbi:ATP-binding protein [Candidatus Palauibacter sp.]|uniref:ATP-binding protein n=1 Tax=Candidatus Palauibacter sp. TaxID=3101350 RepID=UPI003AF2E7AE
MSEPTFYPRYVERRLAEALEDSPVVLIHGPRQCGKTTLALYTCAPRYIEWPGVGDLNWPGIGRISWGVSREYRDYTYISFDDTAVRDGARADPVGFVADLPERVILDEVQFVPELFPAIKIEVDRRRAPGRFILTGSTNVLLLPALSESLAGRLQIVRLHPLSQSELVSRSALSDPGAGEGFLTALLRDGFKVGNTERLGTRLAELVVAGGFPPALARPTPRRQGNWYRDYIETLVQRDVRDMTRIRSLDALPQLLRAAASQTARLYNLADLAAPFQLSRPTIGEYIALLERLFLLEKLPPWHSNRLSRLVKTPKLHLADTGVAAALLGVGPEHLAADRPLLGQLLETFVFQELRRQGSWHEAATEFFHFRDRDGVEVDIVLERGTRAVAGVEIKAAATVRQHDFRGLRKLALAAGDRFRHGVVLYDGETTVSFGDRLYAVPIRRLWEIR